MMRIHRSPSFVLMVFIAALALGLQHLYAAETLTLSDISPKQAGSDVAVGGMGTGNITIRIFKPKKTVVWKELATKGRPDHFWDASFTLPQAVTGHYRIEVMSQQGRVSKTFAVIAGERKADEGGEAVLAYHG
jgi:hypothetical protein